MPKSRSENIHAIQDANLHPDQIMSFLRGKGYSHDDISDSGGSKPAILKMVSDEYTVETLIEDVRKS